MILDAATCLFVGFFSSSGAWTTRSSLFLIDNASRQVVSGFSWFLLFIHLCFLGFLRPVLFGLRRFWNVACVSVLLLKASCCIRAFAIALFTDFLLRYIRNNFRVGSIAWRKNGRTLPFPNNLKILTFVIGTFSMTMRPTAKLSSSMPPNEHKSYSLPRHKFSSTLVPYLLACLKVLLTLHCVSELLCSLRVFSLFYSKKVLQ